MTDRDNAAHCGVAVKTIRRWRRLYRRRGLPRGSPTSAPCPRCEGAPLDEAAYALLLGWYLGDGHLVRGRNDVWSLSIYNDVDYVELNDEIAATLVAVKGAGRVTRRSHPGCIETKLYWKHWACVFPQAGPGMKHTRPIVLEEWQRQVVKRFPHRFVRGLFHSDGCRITNWTVRHLRSGPRRYEYPRYFFSNKSEDIINLCTWALDLLDIAWRRTNPQHVSVARREAVAALDLHVGPKS
ncbi:transcriptional regulator [Tenggerimyces flavus]|uniref:Transcriptional regulator n=1 Tax=Tenggerimyces flavus TaxID=1708749 RepID=A0ABV7YJR1_9ACTN|nr:transcriptional regulator [Tenggerimyces flavus]MBM7787554.1 hypothetical protein [Tenggerimyces flavus]